MKTTSTVLSMILSLLLASACAPDGDEDLSIDEGVTNVETIVVDAALVNSMPAGQNVRLDLALDAVYLVDFSTPFDFNRVTLSYDEDSMTLREWLVVSENLGIDHTAAADEQFAVAGDPSYFGLSQEQLHQLETQQVAASDSVTYWCALLAYGCHHY